MPDIADAVDVAISPPGTRHVTLVGCFQYRPLGFYIRDGTNVRLAPCGLERLVPSIFISLLVPGGLAEESGLGVNDEVLEVNGIEVTGMPLDEVTGMMAANSHNLILTVKPAQQQPQQPRAHYVQ